MNHSLAQQQNRSRSSEAGPKRLATLSQVPKPIWLGASSPFQARSTCACGGGCPRCQSESPKPHLQTQLAVSAPGDHYEREADRVADHVMQMTAPVRDQQAAMHRRSAAVVQRKCAQCDAEEELIQKKEGPDPGTASDQSHAVPTMVHEALRSPGQPLDRRTRTFMEPRFGRDFSQVRIHTDALASQSARTVNALAYTVGQDVVFAAGRYAPETPGGWRLLAHELAHTIQQQNVSTAPQAKLEVDSTNSANEVAADRAADAVMAGHPVPALSAIGPTLSRQEAGRSSSESPGQCHGELGAAALTQVVLPTASAPTGRYTISRVERVSDNERRVHLSTGQRYLVRRNPWTTTEEVPATTASATPGLDEQQVWLDVEFCRGSTEGSIRVGANVPDQVSQLILNTISSGGDVSAAWRQASITPEVRGQLHVGRWQVNLRVATTVDSSGRDQGVSGEASVEVDTSVGRVRVGASGGSQPVGGDPFGGVQGTATATIEFGARPRPTPHCTRMRTRSGFSYECREERDVAPETRAGVRDVSRRDEVIYNLFFKYAVADFDDARNTATLAAMAASLGTGYQVTRIEGWASPEGPMPAGRGATAFMGNEELSNRRAEAARQRIVGLCGAANCMAPGVVVVAGGERLDPTDAAGQPQDVSGRPLEQHVDQTFPTDPGEASVQSPALTERLRRTRSLHGRAEQIYPWLRRAIITLLKTSSRTDPCSYELPGHTEEAYLPSCPDDIRSAAFPSSTSSP